MTEHNDWDPRANVVLADQIKAYDRMRRRCPVAHSDYLHYSVFRHADVSHILEDHDTYSNQASSHVSVPNSMDPPEHTLYRAVIDTYFTPEQMARFAPVCRQVCKQLIERLPGDGHLEVMFGLAHRFAVHMQCAFLGWDESMHEPLLQWINKKNVATLAGDIQAIAAVATEFDETIRHLLRARREMGTDCPDDVTTRLMHETVHGRQLNDEEIVSILRNWTVGELSTIASSVGIIVYYLAQHHDIQQYLRQHPEKAREASDEILRIHGPLIANRRVPACPVRLGNKQIQKGERLTLMWAAANRDETVFGDPDAFRLDRDPSLNLLYGKGIHVCPGAPLARMELEVLIQSLLQATTQIQAVTDHPPIMAAFPVSGYHQVEVTLQYA